MNTVFHYFPVQVELLLPKKGNESLKNMRSFTPKIIEKESNPEIDQSLKTKIDTKPIIQSYHLKKKITTGYSMNDIDKISRNNILPNLSMESLRSILKNTDVSYLENGEIFKHDIGGSAPDLKKIFVTEFI